MNLVKEKRKKQHFLVQTNQKNMNLPRKQKILIKKNLIDKIHKLIVKELKFNINHHNQTRQNHNLLQI
jgi:hypothetical protein